MIDRTHPTLPVTRQCRILNVSRATVYRHPAAVSDADLELMALIDRQYLIRRFYGSRRRAAWLNTQGHAVNRKRVQQLMRLMGLVAMVTVDDTGARHAGANEYTTHIGNDCFAWFATRPSKSRLNFLDLLRAGHPDYVINATALAYLVEHGVPESIVAALLTAGPRSFADDAAWQAHLDSFGLGVGQRRRVTEAAMVGAIVARGLLTDTVIVSDDAGQFDVFQHALCWIHAERHLRRIVCVPDEQHRLVDVQRQLVWWFYADLKLYKDDPTATRRT